MMFHHRNRVLGGDLIGAMLKSSSSARQIVFHAAGVPWSYPDSRFPEEYDRMAAWLAKNLPQSAASERMRMDWKTAGRCVSRAGNELEPDRFKRLDGLGNIGIDETSCRKGPKSITAVMNHEPNTVVWAAPGHSKSFLESFSGSPARSSVPASEQEPETAQDGSLTASMNSYRIGNGGLTFSTQSNGLGKLETKFVGKLVQMPDHQGRKIRAERGGLNRMTRRLPKFLLPRRGRKKEFRLCTGKSSGESDRKSKGQA